MENSTPIPCCPDYPNCVHAEKAPRRIPNVMPSPTELSTGTAFLPDGTPVVVMTDVNSGQVHTFNVVQAGRLGMRLIHLSEQAVTNALIYDTMCSNGTDPLEALKFVQAFQAARNEVLTGKKKSFHSPPHE
jgi:hypothetical protein